MSLSTSSTPSPLPRYKEVKLLGKGAYGSVFLLREIQTNARFAVKRVANPLSSRSHPRLVHQALCELELLSVLNHKNVLKLREAFLSPEYIAYSAPSDPQAYVHIIMEYYPFDLRQLIYSQAYLYRYQVKKIMYDLLCAINYLHSRKIVHRDIKPGNILGNHNGEYCLCDFSLTRGLASLKDDIYEKRYLEEYGDTTKYEEEVSENALDTEPIETPKILNPRLGSRSFLSDLTIPTLRKSATDPVRKKQLTTHVTTRWYRAPEIILIEKYNTAIDIWGAGCVFGELLQTIKEVKKDYKKRRPLFLGDYSFPLTPPPKDKLQEERKNGRIHVLPLPNDQITKIVKLLGYPSEEDLEFIENKDARAYMENLKECETIGLNTMLPNLTSEERDLLQKMLEFNPNKRITAKQALEHPYFDSVRDSLSKEVGGVITLEAEDKSKTKCDVLMKYCTK